MNSRIAIVSLALTVVGCEGLGVITTGDDQGNGVDPTQLEGAGGRSITEYWPSIEIPLSENTRMLSFDMMRNEVMRATGHSWVVDGQDMWERNRGALGGADYQTTFVDDLTPSQQRIVLWRKMAFQVCTDLVDDEAGASSRLVFLDVDPAASFDPASSAVQRQILALFRRFFLADAEDQDVADARELLQALAPGGQDGRTAWRGLCVAYLSSMRFLTY
jgi:hypothetical protein